MNARSSFFALSLGLVGLPGLGGAQNPPIGLSTVGAQRFDNELLFDFPPEEGDWFGAAVATGDFDGDGVEDLATGIPLDDGLSGSGCTDCGAVVVRYGIAGSGLETGVASELLSPQFTVGPGDVALPNEWFGEALAAGDFNGDSIDDLAVGVTGDRSGEGFPGAVRIFYGLPGGIEHLPELYLQPLTLHFAGQSQRFGAALAVGDFNGDGFDDLAVGQPRAMLFFAEPVGAVQMFHGSAGGLSPLELYSIHQSGPGMPDDAEIGDQFGAALAAGDFNGDDFDDLVIGVPGEDDVGGVHTLFGSEGGFLFYTSLWWRPEDLGPAGGIGELGDQFGAALAAGDFDGDGFDDLAVGSPGENLCSVCLQGDATDTGMVNAVYGDPVVGFNLGRSQFFEQATDNEPLDFFGSALATGDFNRDGRDELAIGHFGESSGAGFQAGAVTTVLGTPSGLCCTGRRFDPGAQGIPGDPSQAGARSFGFALASGDFDADGYADLSIGVPSEDVNGLGNVGIEVVLYGALFADGFGSSDASLWTSRTP